MEDLVAHYLEQLRLRLLDMSGRNRLLNFKFSERSRTQIRVIDELPNQIFEKLEKGSVLTLAFLPEKKEHPTDEDNDAFLELLATMRETDEEYLASIEALDEVDTSSEEFLRIDRKLRDKVRDELIMPIRQDLRSIKKVDYAKSLDINPEYDLLNVVSVDRGKASSRKSSLQTLLYPNELERKLAGLREAARKSVQETGLNTLYLAFGMLEWAEPESEKRFLSPLLLYPVALDRQLREGQYHYSIKSFDGDLEENYCLRERLKQDYGIILPTFNYDDKEKDTPESYFEKVEQIIAKRKHWKVRRFLTISLFSFGGIALFHDLNPERWPKTASIVEHPLVSSILCGQEEVCQDAIAPDYDVDDPSIGGKIPLLITDADASQCSAIVDAMDGKSLVIEGPPGTGKSQTITNLIAAALAKGKTVLFVAEKKAALEVVYNRLADAGLENYCLELHSTVTNRQSFYDRLKKRVQQHSPQDVSLEHDELLSDCHELKQVLSSYSNLLNRPFGRSGKTIQELFWAEKIAHDRLAELSLPSNLLSIQDDQAASMTAVDLQRKCQHLREFCQQHQSFIKVCPTPTKHPLYGLTPSNLSPIDQGTVLEKANQWSKALKELDQCVQDLSHQLETPLNTSLSEVYHFRNQLRLCPSADPLMDVSLLPLLGAVQNQSSVKLLVQIIRRYHQEKEILNRFFNETTFKVPDISKLKYISEIAKRTELSQYKNCSIFDFGRIAKRTKDISQQLKGYKQIVQQIAGFFKIESDISPSDLRTIALAIQILTEQSLEIWTKRSQELCDASNSTYLKRGEDEQKRLSKLRDELRGKYNLHLVSSPDKLHEYARKYRSANIFSQVFDSDYHKAKDYWSKIRRSVHTLSNASIADELDRIARYQEDLNFFLNDKNLLKVCGNYFKGLETNFNVLSSVNSFANRLSIALSSYSKGYYVTQFVLSADIETLEKIARLQSSKKFKSLLEQIDSLRFEPEFDEAISWEVLAEKFQRIAQSSMQVHEGLSALGLDPTTSVEAIPDLIDRISSLLATQQQMDLSDIAHGLGRFYQGEQTDIQVLEKTVDFAESVVQTKLPPAIQKQLFSTNAVDVLPLLHQALADLTAALEEESVWQKAFFDLGQPNLEQMFGGQDFKSLPLLEISKRIDRAVSASGDFAAWLSYHRAAQQVADDGLQVLIDGFTGDQLELENLEDVYQYVFYRSLLRIAYQKYPELQQLSGVRQAQVREQFQVVDKRVLKLSQEQLASQLAQYPIESGLGRGRRSEWTNLALIQNEVNKTKRHISVRHLFQRANVALQQLMPCWMMSPASVAQFVPPEAVNFDLLIIDEASQMRPEEALGSVARAKQLIVVGDPKQLPPTDFFKARFDPDLEQEADEDADVLENESILDMSLKVFFPARRLKWHYRSRHESLIAFSNQHFYDNGLTIFPAPSHQCAVEYQYVDVGSYRSGENVPEASVVANAAAEFMRQSPHLSLGIVTLNQKQQDRLLTIMDDLFASHPELESYRSSREESLEPFFVKNLENVQGDERDVILISTVYGPESPGMSVAQRFGPINFQNGHRRLNVLFTRAKERVVVFSSMNSSDIRPTPSSSRGVHALKAYLDYAQANSVRSEILPASELKSDFEHFVAQRLCQEGYKVVPRLGVSGYFIDLAVVDPQRPETYLLGIECDGANYHSAKSVRDRDRLRQEVLERLGWKLYRIWSTDWFANPIAETEKLMSYLWSLKTDEKELMTL